MVVISAAITEHVWLLERQSVMNFYSVYSFYNGHFPVAADHVAVEFICRRLSVSRYKGLPKPRQRTRLGVSS